MKTKIAKGASAEKEQLAKLEATIAKGMGTFIEVGLALESIKRDELYRAAGFSKFTEYYQQKWGYDKSYISRLMSGAALGQAIQKKMPKLNLLESHVRALAPLVEKVEKNEDADFGPAIELVAKLTASGRSVLTADEIKTEVSKGQRKRAVKAMDPGAATAKLGEISVINSPQEAHEFLALVCSALTNWTKSWPRLDRPDKFKGFDQPVKTAIAKLELIDAWLEQQVPTSKAKAGK